MLLPADPLDPAFLAAGTALQVADLCLTHADNPSRTARFLAGVQTGRIRLVLLARDTRSRHALTALGVDPEQITIIPALSRRAFRHLKAAFWRGTLHGQVEAVYRDRTVNPEKVREFQLAAYAGLLDFSRLSALPGYLQLALARLGVPLPHSETPLSNC